MPLETLVERVDLSADFDVLASCGYGLPIEVVLCDPQSEAAKLYRVNTLRKFHPVRIVIPITSGFSKAVKVAAALHLPIKLEGEPSGEVMDELCLTLDFFLHNRAVSEPIEPLSSLLTAMVHNLPVTQWELHEGDPILRRLQTAAHELATDLSRYPNTTVEAAR